MQKTLIKSLKVVIFHVKSQKIHIAAVTSNPIRVYFTKKPVWFGYT